MSDDPVQPWAVYDTSGGLAFLDLSRDEESVWRIYLGWPDKAEIDAAKARGLRAMRVNVTPLPALFTGGA